MRMKFFTKQYKVFYKTRMKLFIKCVWSSSRSSMKLFMKLFMKYTRNSLWNIHEVFYKTRMSLLRMYVFMLQLHDIIYIFVFAILNSEFWILNFRNFVISLWSKRTAVHCGPWKLAAEVPDIKTFTKTPQLITVPTYCNTPWLMS